MDKQPLEDYRHHVRPAIISKLEEFNLLGYEDVTEDKLWSYLLNKKWKKTTELALHEVVRDILSLKVGEFMNYATVESYKGTSWFESNEGKTLLKGLV